jgi:hypothetical protein
MPILFRISFLFFLVSLNLFGQRMDSPIDPVKERNDSEIGFFIGLGGNNLNGTMYVDCETCEFNSGNKFSYTLGLLYMKTMNEWFKYGIALSYDDYSIQSDYLEIIPQSYEAEVINVPFGHTAELNMAGLSAMPYIQFDRLKFVYLRTGPVLSYILGKELTHTMTLEESRIITGDGRVIDLSLLDGNENQVLFEDNELVDYTDLLFFWNLNLGFNIELDDRNTLSPSFQYKIPLNNVSEYKETYKISQWHILLEYRYFISKRRK